MRTVTAVMLAGVIAGCGSAPDRAAPDRVTGLITAVSRDDRGEITSFTVEEGGTRYAVRVDARRDYGFDLEHLEEHRTQRLPVRVTLKERAGELVAVQILDA